MAQRRNRPRRELSHRIVALDTPKHASDTPKHASWLNQTERWLLIPTRRVSRRQHFTSLDDLRAIITAFITKLSHSLAKPLRWTCQGNPVAA